MAGVDVGGGRGRRRAVDSEINMVPMIDLLMVTISFLLLTAVWTHMGRLEGSTRVPGPPDPSKPVEEPAARMHVEVPRAEAPLKLTLRRGPEVLDARTFARGELGVQLAAMRHAHAAELAGDDGRVVVMHADDAIAYRDMIGVMDAIAKDPRNRVSLATK